MVDVLRFNYKRKSLKQHQETNHHNVAVNMEVQLVLTALESGIEGTFKEVMSAERKGFIGHIKCTFVLAYKGGSVAHN